MDEIAGRNEIDDRARLGDLETDGCRRNIVFGKCVLQKIEERSVAEGGSGQVDCATCYGQPVLHMTAIGHDLEGTPHDPAVDELDQPKSLCGRQEVGRRNQCTRLVVHPHEHLEVDAGVANLPERDDLLSVESEPILVQSFMNTLNPVHLAHAVEKFLVLVVM